MLAAPVLLPLAQAIPVSQRAAVLERSPTMAQPPPFTFSTLATLVQPEIYGNPRDATWKGPDNFNEAATGYAGLLPLAVPSPSRFSTFSASITYWRATA